MEPAPFSAICGHHGHRQRAGTIGGARTLFATVLAPEYRKDEVLSAMHLLERPTTAVVHRSAPASMRAGRTPTLEAIAARGSLRVGYCPTRCHIAFFNERGDLVGYDIELAHRLAVELGVELHLIPVTRDDLSSCSDGACDLVMSGVVITTKRASQSPVLASYWTRRSGCWCRTMHAIGLGRGLTVDALGTQ